MNLGISKTFSPVKLALRMLFSPLQTFKELSTQTTELSGKKTFTFFCIHYLAANIGQNLAIGLYLLQQNTNHKTEIVYPIFIVHAASSFIFYPLVVLLILACTGIFLFLARIPHLRTEHNLSLFNIASLSFGSANLFLMIPGIGILIALSIGSIIFGCGVFYHYKSTISIVCSVVLLSLLTSIISIGTLFLVLASFAFHLP